MHRWGGLRARRLKEVRTFFISRSQAPAWERTLVPSSAWREPDCPQDQPVSEQSRSFALKRVPKPELGNQKENPQGLRPPSVVLRKWYDIKSRKSMFQGY